MRIKPYTLGIRIKGVRQTKSSDVFIEVQSKAEGKSKLTCAMKEAVGVKGNVRELVPCTEAKVLHLKECASTKQCRRTPRHGITVPISCGREVMRKRFRG